MLKKKGLNKQNPMAKIESEDWISLGGEKSGENTKDTQALEVVLALPLIQFPPSNSSVRGSWFWISYKDLAFLGQWIHSRSTNRFSSLFIRHIPSWTILGLETALKIPVFSEKLGKMHCFSFTKLCVCFHGHIIIINHFACLFRHIPQLQYWVLIF